MRRKQNAIVVSNETDGPDVTFPAQILQDVLHFLMSSDWGGAGEELSNAVFKHLGLLSLGFDELVVVELESN